MTLEFIFILHVIKSTIPSLSKSSTQRQQSLYDGSFAVMGPRLWNIIPSDLHLIEDPLLFKAKLSEFLKPFPDNPSVSNYSCPNGNSLLDWSMNKAAAILQGRSNYSMTQQRIVEESTNLSQVSQVSNEFINGELCHSQWVKKTVKFQSRKQPKSIYTKIFQNVSFLSEAFFGDLNLSTSILSFAIHMHSELTNWSSKKM